MRAGPEMSRANLRALRAGAIALAWMTVCSRCLAVEESTVGAPSTQSQPASGSQPVEDFTQLNLEQLMGVKVPIVYGASKHEQKVTEAPSAVSIVTQDDIQKFGYRTLADVLRSARGFFVTYDRSYSYIGVRGINRPGDFGGRVLITVDGHRLNEPLYDSAFNGNDFPLDVDLIDRVEIIRGAGSSLYGNNAFFAVINVVTRRGGAMNGVELSGAAASYDTYTGRLSYGKHFTNGLELVVSGSLFDSTPSARPACEAIRACTLLGSSQLIGRAATTMNHTDIRGLATA